MRAAADIAAQARQIHGACEREVEERSMISIAAGYSDQFRRVLMDLYARYSKPETMRRSRRD